MRGFPHLSPVTSRDLLLRDYRRTRLVCRVFRLDYSCSTFSIWLNGILVGCYSFGFFLFFLGFINADLHTIRYNIQRTNTKLVLFSKPPVIYVYSLSKRIMSTGRINNLLSFASQTSRLLCTADRGMTKILLYVRPGIVTSTNIPGIRGIFPSIPWKGAGTCTITCTMRERLSTWL